MSDLRADEMTSATAVTRSIFNTSFAEYMLYDSAWPLVAVIRAGLMPYKYTIRRRQLMLSLIT